MRAALALLLIAGPARAAQHTAVVFDPATATLEYTQGGTVSATLHLIDEDGAVVPGTSCTDANDTQPCRVRWSVAATVTPDETELLGPIPAEETVVDEEGATEKRVVLVDGAHGPDVLWLGSDEGTSYTITAEFLGHGFPDVNECLPEAPDVDDGKLCPSTATFELLVKTETPSISIQPGTEGDLDDTVELVALVEDPNGDARLDDGELEGPGPKPLPGRTVTFFFDVNGDRRPDVATETIGDAETNAAGVASLEWLMDSDYVGAGTFDEGLFAQVAGDDQYATVRATSRIVIHGGEVAAKKTILEVEPKEVPADGVSTILLRARLVDEFGNLLDEDSPAQAVVFTSEIGALEDEPKRDANNGTYTQTLRATREGGESKVTVKVNGTEGASTTVTFVKEGCQCTTSRAAPLDTIGLAACALALAFVRRRTR